MARLYAVPAVRRAICVPLHCEKARRLWLARCLTTLFAVPGTALARWTAVSLGRSLQNAGNAASVHLDPRRTRRASAASAPACGFSRPFPSKRRGRSVHPLRFQGTRGELATSAPACHFSGPFPPNSRERSVRLLRYHCIEVVSLFSLSELQI